MLSLDDKLEKVSKYVSNSDGSKVLGYGKNDYLMGHATNNSELVKLLKNKKVKGVIIEDTAIGSVCISFENGTVHNNENVLAQKDAVEYETKQLLVAGGISSKSLKREIESNNKFIVEMIPVFSKTEDLLELNQIYVEYGKVKDLPLFHSLNVKTNNLSLRVTKQQMSIITGSGLLKVHNTKRNVDSWELAELIATLFKTPKTELYNAFSSTDSEDDAKNVKVI